MARVRLIHWNKDEGRARQKQLEALGFEVQYDAAFGGTALRLVRASDEPDAVVIDMTRMPSQGRELGRVIRMTKSSRHWPLVFVDGDPERIAHTKLLLPDATYTTWPRVKPAVTRAIARPPETPVVPKDIMSAKPTIEKLGVKAGYKVALLGAPQGFAGTLRPLPAKVKFTAKVEPDADLFLCLVRAATEMHAHFLSLKATIDRQTLWMIWPKKASKVKTNLNGNVVREAGLEAGWVDFKVCAVDETWSGLAFKKRK